MRSVEAANIRAIEVSQTPRAADASAVDTAEVRAVNPRRAASDATKLCTAEPGSSSACATKPGSSSAEVGTTTAAEMASATTARRGKFSSQKCDAAERKTCRKNFEDLVRHNAHSRQNGACGVNLMDYTKASLMYVNQFDFRALELNKRCKSHAKEKSCFNRPFLGVQQSAMRLQ